MGPGPGRGQLDDPHAGQGARRRCAGPPDRMRISKAGSRARAASLEPCKRTLDRPEELRVGLAIFLLPARVLRSCAE